ncbi:hypothetical protein KR222_002780, partial [Zaprionus bogoriensis]
SNRRQRLGFALSMQNPYDQKSVNFSELQEQVEQIIATLRIDDGTPGAAEEQTNKENAPEQQPIEVEECAEQSMQDVEEVEEVEEANDSMILVEEDRCEDIIAWVNNQNELLAQAQINELMKNNMQATNEARVDLLMRWERSKRKALDLLSIEIDKVQSIASDDDPTSDDDEEYLHRGRPIAFKRKRTKRTMVTSTPKFSGNCPPFEFDTDSTSRMVKIGPNGTQVKRSVLEAINWTASGPAITRKLLCEIFDRGTLAHHTLSDEASSAFKDQQLDPLKVADLVYLMTKIMNMTPREVRNAIITKCADESKMLRCRRARFRSR